MRMALADAGLAPQDIDYINAHAAGTPAGDLAEAQSIRAVFGGGDGGGPMVSSTKAVHGHTLGAAGALEFVLTAQALRAQAAPPTAFLDELDPACEIERVPSAERSNRPLRAAMSNSFAFGGSNVALIVKQYV
jgi:3-oxoacyl-[acyl-carrier-protein] synthase II